MTKEELERLYMDIYDNGVLDNDYKEKFKRYVNNRLKSLEKENEELKEQNIKDCENFNKIMKETKEQWNKEHYQLIKAKDLLLRFIELKNKPCAVENSVNMLLYENISAEAEQFLSEV